MFIQSYKYAINHENNIKFYLKCLLLSISIVGIPIIFGYLLKVANNVNKNHKKPPKLDSLKSLMLNGFSFLTLIITLISIPYLSSLALPIILVQYEIENLIGLGGVLIIITILIGLFFIISIYITPILLYLFSKNKNIIQTCKSTSKIKQYSLNITYLLQFILVSIFGIVFGFIMEINIIIGIIPMIIYLISSVYIFTRTIENIN